MPCSDRIEMMGILVRIGQDTIESVPTYSLSCYREVEFPGKKRGKTEDTCLDDQSGFKAFCQGFAERQPFKLKARCNKADMQFLENWFDGGDDRNVTLFWPLKGSETLASRFECRGFCEEFMPQKATAGSDEKLDVEFSIFPHTFDFIPGT